MTLSLPRSCRSTGFFCGKRPRPPFLPRPHAAVPQIDEGGEARLQRLKTEPVAGVLDVRPIHLLDDRLDAAARLPRRLRQPAGEEHVVLGLELLEPGLEPLQFAFGFAAGRHGSLSGAAGTRPAAATARGRTAPADRRSAPRWHPIARPARTDPSSGPHRTRRSARGSGGQRPSRLSRNSADARASSSARSNCGMSSRGKTSVIENGRGRGPNSASCRSGSIAISSSSVGCSGRSAYGQKRSSGRCFGVSAGMLDCKCARCNLQFAMLRSIPSCRVRSPRHSLDRAAAAAAGHPRARGPVRRVRRGRRASRRDRRGSQGDCRRGGSGRCTGGDEPNRGGRGPSSRPDVPLVAPAGD